MKPEESPEGYWQVGEKKFLRKYDAQVEGTKNIQRVRYIYFDDIWQHFDRSSLGKFSLKELYKIRAQQLRDEYDYLIVYFSGGGDSYNVIRSFVDNGIKLDEVCVRWPMAAIKAGVYTPDSSNVDPRNTLSEWDYAIKPKLEWLAQAHPEVKINIVDWTENFSEKSYTIELFQTVNNFNDVEIPFMMSYSPSERELVEKGKKVGSIYGIEKPKIYRVAGRWFMSFIDIATSMGTPSLINPLGTEYFYWSPKFPILAFEQAHTLARYLDGNPDLKKYFGNEESQYWDYDTSLHYRNMQNTISRQVLYDNWDNAFQANKPEIPDRADKHFWIFEHPELERIRDHYVDTNAQFLSQLSSDFVMKVFDKFNTLGKPRGIYYGVSTKHFYVKEEENSVWLK
jgi:hypothetical protein